jgi:hypothetical protein
LTDHTLYITLSLDFSQPLDEGGSLLLTRLEGDRKNESNIGFDEPARLFAADDSRSGGVFDAVDALGKIGAGQAKCALYGD